MTKIIKLSYMIDGVRPSGEPCKDIEDQVNDIFKENPNYKYVDLIYRDSKGALNMEHATLIVEILNT